MSNLHLLLGYINKPRQGLLKEIQHLSTYKWKLKCTICRLIFMVNADNLNDVK